MAAGAKAALETLRREFAKTAPGLVAAWERSWDTFVPFLEFHPAIRKVIYTTNAIVIFSSRVSQGCELRRPVVDSVVDGTLAA